MNNPIETQVMTLKVLGSIVITVKDSLIPYFPQVIALLRGYLSQIYNGDTQPLLLQAMGSGSSHFDLKIKSDKKIQVPIVLRTERRFQKHIIWGCMNEYLMSHGRTTSDRATASAVVAGAGAAERDDHGWLTCTAAGRTPAPLPAHAPHKLLLTQIAAGGTLQTVARKAHAARSLWALGSCHACGGGEGEGEIDQRLAAIARKMLKEAVGGNLKKEEKVKEENCTTNGSPVKTEGKNGGATTWPPDVPAKTEDGSSGHSDSSSSDSDSEGNYSTLRELLIRPSASAEPANGVKKARKSKLMVDDVISSVIKAEAEDAEGAEDTKPELKDLAMRKYKVAAERTNLPIRIMTLAESKMLYPDVPHSWLCDGKLLHLTDPNNPGNYKLFQDQWKRGQPVLVSDVSKQLDKDLWLPESFSRDFGDAKTDLVNCASGLVVPNQPSRKFWDGFDLASKRLRDEHGAPMVLKLKDWPPGEDFAELLPARFNDLMAGLPLREFIY